MARRNQIEWLAARQYFRNPPEKPAGELTRLADPFDDSLQLMFVLVRICMPTVPDVILKRVGNSAFAIEFNTLPEQAKLIDASAVHQTFGLPNAKVVSSGHPEQSILLHRMGLRGSGPNAATGNKSAG